MPRERTLQLDLETEEVTLGDDLSVTIAIRPKKSLHVQKATVALGCYGTFPGPPASNYGWAGRSPLMGTLLARVDEQVFGDQTLHEGTEHVFQATLRIPGDGLPTYVGKYVGVWWTLEAKVAVKLARDLRARAAVFVLAPSPKDPISMLATIPHEVKGDCALQFILPTTAVKQGQDIQGKLSVQPLRDVEAREVRVELRRVEGVLHGPVILSDVIRESSLVVSSATKLPGALTQTFDFRFRVPSDHYQPTVKAPGGMAYWELAAILEHSPRRKCSTTEPLAVYNAEGRP